MRITIVGRGRVGRGLARALASTEHEVRLVRGRSTASLETSDVVLLTVPDPAIAATAARIAPSRGVVLHASGSLGADVLRPSRGAVGVMHPLVSFADPARPPSLTGTTFVIAGDPKAIRAARRLARAVGARALTAEVHGPAYHAAAALSANGAAALASVAVRVMEALGLERRDAQRAIGALLRTVGENVERVGVPGALSGPVIRGDDETIARHRRALEALDPEARAAYDAVAPAILDCATRAGLAPDRAAAVRRALARRGAQAGAR